MHDEALFWCCSIEHLKQFLKWIRAEELEGEIARLKEELFGPAASDYVRAAEIQEIIDRAEEELLTLYEILL